MEPHALGSTPATALEIERPGRYGPLEVLSVAECLAMLARLRLGRLAVVADGRPLILPVNYCLDGHDVVLLTDAGTKLDAARDAPVAFEIDGTDGLYHLGWSVLVTGTAEEVTDPAERDRLAHLPLVPWCEGAKDHWLRIRPTAITGRRIPPHGPRPEDRR